MKIPPKCMTNPNQNKMKDKMKTIAEYKVTLPNDIIQFNVKNTLVLSGINGKLKNSDHVLVSH